MNKDFRIENYIARFFALMIVVLLHCNIVGITPQPSFRNIKKTGAGFCSSGRNRLVDHALHSDTIILARTILRFVHIDLLSIPRDRK